MALRVDTHVLLCYQSAATGGDSSRPKQVGARATKDRGREEDDQADATYTTGQLPRLVEELAFGWTAVAAARGHQWYLRCPMPICSGAEYAEPLCKGVPSQDSVRSSSLPTNLASASHRYRLRPGHVEQTIRLVDTRSESLR